MIPVPKAAAANIAPNNASHLGSGSVGLSITIGKEAERILTASSAISDTIGFAFGAATLTTACAMALRPLGPAISAGSVIINSGSYKVREGTTASSRPVTLPSSPVIPQMLVISEPANVVGIAIFGSPSFNANAFPSPVVEPPPIETVQSAFFCSTSLIAS